MYADDWWNNLTKEKKSEALGKMGMSVSMAEDKYYQLGCFGRGRVRRYFNRMVKT